MVSRKQTFPARVLSMPLFQEAPAEFQPFYINPMATTELIQLSVWRGDRIDDPKFKTLTVSKFLEQQAKSKQWVKAKWLSMQDEKLRTFTQADFSSFDKIHSWDANLQFSKCLIQQKLIHSNCYLTVLKVHEGFRTADFHEALGNGNFENGVYKEKRESVTIRVTFDEEEKSIEFET